MSAFTRYWQHLKENEPSVYQEKLKQNRERIRRLRKEIYNDPAKHAAYKAKQREAYKQRIAAKKSKTKND